MRQAVELISEMMILERGLEQVGAVAVTTAYSFGRRVSGFAGFASLASRSEQSGCKGSLPLGAGGVFFGGARRFGRLWSRLRRENVDSKKFSLPHTQSSESRPRRPFVEFLGVG